MIYIDPRIPHFTNEESFEGKVVHSSGYKSGKEFKGKKVGQHPLIRIRVYEML
jgi:cation diffusion facilitator CzcD-associated flavoprotein CzcO